MIGISTFPARDNAVGAAVFTAYTAFLLACFLCFA